MTDPRTGATFYARCAMIPKNDGRTLLPPRPNHAESFPVLVKFLSQLADTRRTEPELAGHDAGSLADHQVLDQRAIPLCSRRRPGWEVLTKCQLVGHWRLRVVVQSLVQPIAFEGALIGKRTHAEVAQALVTRFFQRVGLETDNHEFHGRKASNRESHRKSSLTPLGLW